MSYSIVITPQAKNDLREIFKYIAFDLQSVQSAAGQIERIEKVISSLDTMPERFKVYDKPIWRKRSLRIMPIDNYYFHAQQLHRNSAANYVWRAKYRR